MTEETNDLPLDGETGEPGAADSVADQADAFIKAQARRARGRPSEADRERQASLADIRITTNEKLARACRAYDAFAEAAAAYRQAAKEIKAIIGTSYPEAVNSDDDGEHSGYVVVQFPESEPDPENDPDEDAEELGRAGAWRFRPRNRYVPEETVEFKRNAGTSWRPLDVEKVSG